jgi:hypothetical protein
LFSHLFSGGDEFAGHRRRHIEHPYTLRFQADLIQPEFDPFHAALGVSITFQVMAVAGQSPGGHDTICAVFERAQHGQYVQPAGARQLHHLDRRRILHPQTSCQVGGGIRAVFAAISDDL